MNKILGLVFLALTFVLASCAPGLYEYHNVSQAEFHEAYRVIPLYVDGRFTKEQRIDLSDAVNEANYMLNGNLRIEVKKWSLDIESEEGKKISETISKTHEGILVLSLSEDDPKIEELVKDNGMLAFVNALGERANILVVVNDRIGNRDLKTIFLHELGHALGAQHTSATSLMYNYYGSRQTKCFDRITVAQIADYNNLDLNTMNYCRTKDFK